MGHVDTAGLHDDFSRILNRAFYTQTDAWEKFWNLHREKAEKRAPKSHARRPFECEFACEAEHNACKLDYRKL